MPKQYEATVWRGPDRWWWAEGAGCRASAEWPSLAWEWLRDETMARGLGMPVCEDQGTRAALVKCRGMEWFCRNARSERLYLEEHLPARIVPGWIASLYAKRSAQHAE